MTDEPQTFTEKGLWFPLGIAVGLGLMVLWNGFFIYQAIHTAPVVDPGYTHAVRR